MMTPSTVHNQPAQPELDLALLSTVLLLSGLGLIMVYSASIAIAESKFGENGTYYFLVRQAISIVLGIGFGMAAFKVSLRQWQTCSRFCLSLALCCCSWY